MSRPRYLCYECDQGVGHVEEIDLTPEPWGIWKRILAYLFFVQQ